jgi:2-phospho-L-lactate transferase/gluconeogenesis factor (CofD/UPF0052 family)
VSAASALRVVLFSGGRGARVLTEQLARRADVSLTVVINGYDDGLSTGEVRRFLGDALGPSDFRKNASRLARLLGTAQGELIDLLDVRLPEGDGEEGAVHTFQAIAGVESACDDVTGEIARLASALPSSVRDGVVLRLMRFESERASTGKPFDFRDCSVGNLVFAGTFLLAQREFNRAVDDYCALLGLEPGLIENVSDGTNAFLVALDRHYRLLASEAALVSATERNQIRDLYLLPAPLSAEATAQLTALAPEQRHDWLTRHSRRIPINPRIVPRLEAADLIIYAPGTQHSSLFPSYLTEGLATLVAANVGATKLLVTNLQPDAETADSSGVDLLDRALYYLRQRNKLSLPTPCLLTHCLINDPARATAADHLPPGRVEGLEDPRLVRIANFERGASGSHDADKVLTPFIDHLLTRHARPRVALLLQGTHSTNKVLQTALELHRGGVDALPIDLDVFYAADDAVPARVADRLPFGLHRLDPHARDARFLPLVRELAPTYVGLFDSSGMYNGADLVGLLSQLLFGEPDAVWGSRRLSLREIRESYRLRYRKNLMLGAISYAGSHVLSLLYLAGYGRYVSDTLADARFVRTRYLLTCGADVRHRHLNHYLLAALLRDKAEIRELPVSFLPLSPARVRRTRIRDGVRALLTVLRIRATAPAAAKTGGTEPEADAEAADTTRARSARHPA